MTDEANSPATSPAGGDQLLRALLPLHNVRVVAAVTTGLAREAARRHGAVGVAAAALARAATAGSLLATMTKDRERLTAELSGDGYLGTLMVDADGTGTVRVYVKNPAAPVGAAPGVHVPLGRAIGSQGLVRVARDLGLKEVVSGQTPLVDGEIDSDIEHYLVSSEQIPSTLGCEALLSADLDVAASGGLLLQTLPGSDALPLLELLRTRMRAGALAEALRAQPPPDAEALARAILGDEAEDLLVLEVSPLRFHCPCSRERAGATLSLLKPEELIEMAENEGGAEITCEFCRARYQFTAAEIEVMRVADKKSPPS